MDSSDEANEVSFRRNGTEYRDSGADESSEGSTKHSAMDSPVPAATELRPTDTSPDEAQRVAIEENLGSVLMYLVGEIKDVKQRVGKPPVIKKEASELSFSDEEDDDSVSTDSTSHP